MQVKVIGQPLEYGQQLQKHLVGAEIDVNDADGAFLEAIGRVERVVEDQPTPRKKQSRQRYKTRAMKAT